MRLQNETSFQFIINDEMLFTKVNKLLMYKEIERNNTIEDIKSLKTFFMKKDFKKIYESEGQQVGLSEIKS